MRAAPRLQALHPRCLAKLHEKPSLLRCKLVLSCQHSRNLVNITEKSFHPALSQPQRRCATENSCNKRKPILWTEKMHKSTYCVESHSNTDLACQGHQHPLVQPASQVRRMLAETLRQTVLSHPHSARSQRYRTSCHGFIAETSMASHHDVDR